MSNYQPNQQLKHSSPSGILSAYNPIVSLPTRIKYLVNEGFIKPQVMALSEKVEQEFSELDPDNLITEIEFERQENFVKNYIYQEIIDVISKNDSGKVEFTPKIVITFDKSLCPKKKNGIHYGAIRLGEKPILVYLYIDLQELIEFIKKLPLQESPELSDDNKKQESGKQETEEEKRDKAITEQQRQLSKRTDLSQKDKDEKIEHLERVKNTPMQGQSGKLRVQLNWFTTDDLDLHIETPNGEIAYNNKSVTLKGITGFLDVDKNAGEPFTSQAVENIYFDAMPEGRHKIFVNLYNNRENKDELNFTIQISPEIGDGKIFDSKFTKKEKQLITTFEYDKDSKELKFSNHNE